MGVEQTYCLYLYSRSCSSNENGANLSLWNNQFHTW